MSDVPSTPDAPAGPNPNDQTRELMALLSQETRHSIVQTLLGHPEVLASADELDYFVANKSRKTVDEQLDRLVEADILRVHEHPANKRTRGLPYRFYGFTDYALDVLDDFNYLKGVPWARAVHQKTKKSEKIERHESAPRPDLSAAVRETFRLDEAESEDAETPTP
jgi:hypothetical protein